MQLRLLAVGYRNLGSIVASTRLPPFGTQRVPCVGVSAAPSSGLSAEVQKQIDEREKNRRIIRERQQKTRVEKHDKFISTDVTSPSTAATSFVPVAQPVTSRLLVDFSLVSNPMADLNDKFNNALPRRAARRQGDRRRKDPNKYMSSVQPASNLGASAGRSTGETISQGPQQEKNRGVREKRPSDFNNVKNADCVGANSYSQWVPFGESRPIKEARRKDDNGSRNSRQPEAVGGNRNRLASRKSRSSEPGSFNTDASTSRSRRETVEYERPLRTDEHFCSIVVLSPGVGEGRLLSSFEADSSLPSQDAASLSTGPPSSPSPAPSSSSSLSSSASSTVEGNLCLLREASHLGRVEISRALPLILRNCPELSASRAEFCFAVTSMLRHEDLPRPEMRTIDALFDFFDTNENESVDVLEILGGLSQMCSGTRHDRIEALFKMFDREEVGSFTMDDFMGIMCFVYRSILTVHLCTDLRNAGVKFNTIDDLAYQTAREMFPETQQPFVSTSGEDGDDGEEKEAGVHEAAREASPTASSSIQIAAAKSSLNGQTNVGVDADGASAAGSGGQAWASPGVGHSVVSTSTSGPHATITTTTMTTTETTTTTKMTTTRTTVDSNSCYDPTMVVNDDGLVAQRSSSSTSSIHHDPFIGVTSSISIFSANEDLMYDDDGGSGGGEDMEDNFAPPLLNSKFGTLSDPPRWAGWHAQRVVYFKEFEEVCESTPRIAGFSKATLLRSPFICLLRRVLSPQLPELMACPIN